MVVSDIPCFVGTILADRLELWLSYIIELRMVWCDISCLVGIWLEVRFMLTG